MFAKKEVKDLSQIKSKKKKKNIKTNPDLQIFKIAGGFLLIILALYLFWVLRKISGLAPQNINESIGVIGAFFYRIINTMMGKGGFFAPLLLIMLGLYLGVPRLEINKRVMLSITGIVCLLLAWYHLDIALAQSISYGISGLGGGLVGALVSYLFIKGFGITGTKFILTALIFVLIYIGSNGKIFAWLKKGSIDAKDFFGDFSQKIKHAIFVDEKTVKKTTKSSKIKKEKEKPLKINQPILSKSKASVVNPVKEDNEPKVFINNLKEYHKELAEENKMNRVNDYVSSGIAEEEAMKKFDLQTEQYELPSLSLLKNLNNRDFEYDQAEIDTNADILQQTLADFGVKGTIEEVSIGPTITEYEFSPAPGNKVSKILNLADDLALNLATTGIRIQAPIPGKAAVGIEVPNKKTRAVLLREVLESDAFKKSQSKLTVALGMDISGKCIVTDLAKMPHLLIAGATGSGKSVCLNALIVSILYKAKPYEVKFLMIDPKMVELGNYNGIPHLISPVVTDSKKAAGTLRWAVKEMERRYDLFASNGVRDIDRFNEKCLEERALGNTSSVYEQLPKIVIIIDELADLMMVAPADVEDAICRLAQMARAAGLHLVIATQRPSVDVITGIIKANIPSRIAFSVSSQVDSRTILDIGGAEKLLGRGDMLFFPTGMAKPKRIQGVFVTDPEIDRVVLKVKNQGSPDYNTNVTEMEEVAASNQSDSESADDMDELMSEAAKLFIENGQASISMLQRHFRIGYTRAARLVDEMESRGFIGPYEGSKPRQIRLTLEDYNTIFGETN